MNTQTLARAKRAAQEFLLRVVELERDAPSMASLTIVGTSRTSAVRRQSMELTRALAAMRR